MINQRLQTFSVQYFSSFCSFWPFIDDVTLFLLIFSFITFSDGLKQPKIMFLKLNTLW